MLVILRRALWGGVALGLLGYLAQTLWLALNGIFFPYQLDYGEGIVLWFTRELALGHSIYKGLEGLPYASSNYPPLTMLFAAPFRSLFGDSYIGGRWLNFASALLVAAFIYRFVKSETQAIDGEGVRFAPGLSVLFFLDSTFIYHWIPLFRVDLIGLALTIAGIFFVWRWEKEVEPSNVRTTRAGGASRQGTISLVLAGLLFLCAIYTKHSLVFAPAAAIVAILFRDRRTALYFAGVLAITAGGIFAALDVWTGGGFAFGLLTSNATLWLWDTFLSLTQDFLWTFLILLALAIWGWVARVRTHRPGVLEIYAVAAVASLGLAGRVGAWENYYFEAVFCVCVFAGIALALLFRQKLAATWWLPLMLLIQLGLFWPEHHPALAGHLMNYTRAANEKVGPLVQATAGTIISEDMGLLVTNGKPVDYYTFQYSSLARAGQWDQHWELDNLHAGGFPLVILSAGTREDIDKYHNFTREFASALDYGYALKYEDERYHVYTPAPLAHLRNADFDGVLQLVGWTLAPEERLSAGQTLKLTLVWRAEQKINAGYTAFAHVEDGHGGVAAQDDHVPRVGLAPYPQPYPTTNWAAGEMVRDTFSLRLSPKLATGMYALRVGWYDSVTQDRLSVQGRDDFVELAAWDVR